MAETKAGALAQQTLSPPRIRAYREFLTPLLHRRFVSAASLVMIVCYIEALALGIQTWTVWLPFTSIIRASLLFIPALVIFLLRIAQLRLTPRTSISPFYSAFAALTEVGSYQVVAFYFFSAWVFSEVHIHAAPYEADLGWVANGELYERLRLNERVIYLRSHAFIMASIQSLLHISNDYSCVRLRLQKPEVNLATGKWTPSTIKQKLSEESNEVAKTVFKRSLVLTFASPFLYLFVRSPAWSWSLSFARLVWNIPGTSEPSFTPPFHWTLLLRTLMQGFLLFGLWESCNRCFTLLVAQEPIKRDKPLTAESKDPNGSLINGLQSKKQAVKSYALWELEVVVRYYGERRKSILTEIDRKGDSAWAQVLRVCLDTIQSVPARISGPSQPSSQAATEAPTTLPRIATPMKHDSVAQAYRPAGQFDQFATFVGAEARKAGAAPPSSRLDLSPQVKKYASNARDRLLTKEQQEALSRDHIQSSAHVFLVQLLRFQVPPTPFTEAFRPGAFFQQSSVRRIKAKLFGNPFGDKVNIVRCIDILTILLVASVTEDTYGVVSRNVPEIWRSFVQTIDGAETLLKTTPAHWTEVDRTADHKDDDEINELLLHLRAGLKKLLDVFGSEASARGLTPADVRDARRLVGSS